MKRWAKQEAARAPEGDDFRFAVEDQARTVVGALTTHDCNRRFGTFAYGVSIRQEHRGKGYATEATA